MAVARLLAIDLDGTLLRNDGTIAALDREAIAGALAGGMAVTLATGRLSSSTLPFARSLGLGDPLVCADGAVLLCPVRGAPLHLAALEVATQAALLECLRQHGLAPFVFTHETVFGAPADTARFPFVEGWTPHVVACDDLDAACTTEIVTAIGVGREAEAVAAEEAVRRHPAIVGDVIAFPLRPTDVWVVRLTPRGCTKAAGLGRLAARLGLAPAEVAVIGDWYNDLSMLAWAGFSFAMGQAPDEVKQAARRTLSATAATGGGIAEALDHLRHLRGT